MSEEQRTNLVEASYDVGRVASEASSAETSRQSSAVPPGGRTRATAMSACDIPRVTKFTTGAGPSTVECMVCQAAIDVRGKERQYVVKCDQCQEATPIRSPPPEKKYVRCVCGCLLVCRAGAVRLICPRPNCRRILDLEVDFKRPTPENQAQRGDVRVECYFCRRSFLFNTEAKVLAHCPHCHKRSAVVKEYVRRRALLYLGLSALLLIVAIGYAIGVQDAAEKNKLLYVLHGLFVGLTLVMILAAIFYFSVPRSSIVDKDQWRV